MVAAERRDRDVTQAMTSVISAIADASSTRR